MNNTILTNEEVSAKGVELERQYNCKIHPLVFMINEGTEQVVGFMKEPPRFVKLRILDLMMANKAMTAAAECLEATLIKEHSDPRIYSEAQEYDHINLGATVAASAIITVSTNEFKKK